MAGSTGLAPAYSSVTGRRLDSFDFDPKFKELNKRIKPSMKSKYKDTPLIKPEENQFSKIQDEFYKTTGEDCEHNCSGECGLQRTKCLWIWCPKTRKK
jgi:hypothetical protein